MTRTAAILMGGFLALAVLDSSAAAQASVEYGTGAASSSGAAGPLKGLGDTLKGILGGGDKTIKSASEPSSVAPAEAPKAAARSRSTTGSLARKKPAVKTAPVPTEPPAVAPAPPNYEDPSQIRAGMAYDELLRRFGPPTLEFTDGPSSKTLSYIRKEGVVQVQFQDGKVSSAQKPQL